MPISKDFQSIHYKRWEIYFSQCDPTAKLKLTELANLFQLTASEHAVSAGLGFFDLQEYNHSWVLNRMRIEIDELPTWNDLIDVKTWVEILKGAKSIRDFTLEKDGQKLLGCSSLWAIFNTVKRRPDILQIDTSTIERYPDLKATDVPNSVLNQDFQDSTIIPYKVKFSDVDMINHVNNTKYLEWCLDTIDPSIMLEHRVKAIDMNFLRELSYNDEVEIHQSIEEHQIQFKITHNEQVNFVCRLELK